MTMSDPIADMLTRIRNANTAKHDTVEIPASKMKVAIAEILLKEGFIKAFDIKEEGAYNNKVVRRKLMRASCRRRPNLVNRTSLQKACVSFKQIF